MPSLKELAHYILVRVHKKDVSWQWLSKCTKNSKSVDRWHVPLSTGPLNYQSYLRYILLKYRYEGWIKVLAAHDDGEFESCQLCGHEQGLFDKLVQPAATVLCQSTVVCRTLIFIGIVRAPYDHAYKTRATFLDQN